MKYITLIIGLLVVGCGKTEITEEDKDADESTPTTNTNEVDGTTVKPVKELTLEEKVVGTYEYIIEDGTTLKVVLLENGKAEGYTNGKKEGEGTRKIVEGKIHVIDENGDGAVYRINKDGSITLIAWTEDGKQEDVQNEDQLLFKKIK